MAGPVINIQIISDTGNAQGKLDNFFKDITSGMAAFALKAAGVVAAMISLRKAFDSIGNAIEVAAELNNISEATGTTVEFLGKLTGAMRVVGMGMQDVTMGLKFFARAATEAATGVGPMADAFNAIGISSQFVKDNLNDTEKLYLASIDGLSKYADGLTKSRIAQQLWGRDGQKFIEVANGGADAIRKTNSLFTTGMAQAAVTYERNINKIKLAFEDIWITVASKLLPVLVDLSGAFLELVKGIVGATTNSEFFQSVMVGIETTLRGTTATVMQIGAAFQFLGTVAQGTFNALGILAENNIVVRWVKDMASAMGALSTISGKTFDALVIGFKGVAKVAIGKVAEGLADIAVGQVLAKEATEAANKVLGEYTRSVDAIPDATGAAAKALTDSTAQAVKDWTAQQAAIDKVLDGTKKLSETTIESPKSTLPIFDSTALQALTDATQKSFTAQTQSKVDAAEAEYALDRQRIQRANISEENKNALLLKLEATFISKKKEMQTNASDEESALNLSKINVQIKALEGNQDIANADKKSRLVELYQAENAEIEQQVAAKRELVATAENDDKRLEANKALNEAMGQQADIQQKLRDLQSDTFYGTLHRNLVQLANEFGNLGRTMANIATGTITAAIDGISNALTSVIMGTKSAGQAFAEMGVQMLTSFIASVISAILWATIAIPILTAFGILSGGSTAAVGLGVVTASLAAAPKLATGGVITGPGGPTEDRVHVWASPGEGFLPYSAMQRIGPAAFEALRRGAIGAQELAQFIPAGMTRPISRSNFASGGTAGADPFAGNVTVAPADIHIHEVRNRQDILDVLASREGQHVIIDHVSKHKAQLGVRT